MSRIDQGSLYLSVLSSASSSTSPPPAVATNESQLRKLVAALDSVEEPLAIETLAQILGVSAPEVEPALRLLESLGSAELSFDANHHVTAAALADVEPSPSVSAEGESSAGMSVASRA
jgi:hypothetical protein